jgi:hypothetical protein
VIRQSELNDKGWTKDLSKLVACFDSQNMCLSYRFTKLRDTVQEANRETLQNNSSEDRRTTKTQGKRGFKGIDAHQKNP